MDLAAPNPSYAMVQRRVPSHMSQYCKRRGGNASSMRPCKCTARRCYMSAGKDGEGIVVPPKWTQIARIESLLIAKHGFTRQNTGGA